MAYVQNLVVDQRSAFTATIALSNLDGSVWDISGLTFQSALKKSFTSATEIARFTITIPDPTTGILTLSFTSDQTAAFVPGRYVYDLIAFDPSSPTTTSQRVLEGLVSITAGVTIPIGC